jgi:hypothetical protein
MTLIEGKHPATKQTYQCDQADQIDHDESGYGERDH